MSIHSELIRPSEVPAITPEPLNGELKPARSAINAALIGLPRGTFGRKSDAPESQEFKALLETADMGPFTVTGLKPAVGALRAIVTDISLERSDLYSRIGCAEMLACRKVRGSNSVISNHSWGIAIDLTLDGQTHIDGREDLMPDLRALARIFNRHGFFLGVGFRARGRDAFRGL